jgi:hypothetical protein
MLPGEDGPRPIAMLECRGSSPVLGRYMAGIGGTGGMLPTEPAPGENSESMHEEGAGSVVLMHGGQCLHSLTTVTKTNAG